MNASERRWAECASAFAFLGNSLLAPMTQTGDIGLDPDFWAGFPDFGNPAVREAVGSCADYAREARGRGAAGEDAVLRASVEYTRLFVGPPRPAAAPWESFYSGKGERVGFGVPAFAMKKLLRESGLEVSNPNNQYADHMGIELLYASELCRRADEAAGDRTAQEAAAAELSAFLVGHPLRWIDRLIEASGCAAPDGYVVRLLVLARALACALR